MRYFYTMQSTNSVHYGQCELTVSNNMNVGNYALEQGIAAATINSVNCPPIAFIDNSVVLNNGVSLCPANYFKTATDCGKLSFYFLIRSFLVKIW